MILAIVLVALFAPAIAPRGPEEPDYDARLVPPSREHLLGTDNHGRDIFSRILYGARIDLQVGIFSVIPPFVIGCVHRLPGRLLRRPRRRDHHAACSTSSRPSPS